MKTSIFLVTLLFISYGIKAQQITASVITTAGHVNKSNSYSLIWTLGELVIETDTNTTNQLTQGFQQPEYLYISINNKIGEPLSIETFPNPTKGKINFRVKSSDIKKLKIDIFDITGKNVGNKNINITEGGISTINISPLVPNIYFMRIYLPDGSLFETVKIIKL